MATATTTVAWDVDRVVDVLGPEAVLSLIGPDLPTPDATLDYEWLCGVERRWWRAEVRYAVLSRLYALRWLWSAEAGADAVEVVERHECAVDEIESLRGYAREAGDGPSGCGKIRLGEVWHTEALES